VLKLLAKAIFREYDTEDFKNGVDTLGNQKELGLTDEPELEFEVDHFFSYQTKILSKNGMAGLLTNTLDLDMENLVLNLNYFDSDQFTRITKNSVAALAKNSDQEKLVTDQSSQK
jgi:hypothetical protein